MATEKKLNLILWEKYKALLAENDNLKAEISSLKSEINNLNRTKREKDFSLLNYKENKEILPDFNDSIKVAGDISFTGISQKSKPGEKIELFKSLFKGREDVYAKRWHNREGKSGYSPVCLNEWKAGICKKPEIKCSDCKVKSFDLYGTEAIRKHLKGEVVIGIYPLCNDDTTNFMTIDFDDDSWKNDITVLRETCSEYNVPISIERSRSGNGAHAWIFFEEPIAASLARKLGSALLTYSMTKRHEIKFKSYDRIFPNQDTIPKGGLGNLIALPLQMEARKSKNSIFVDENFNMYPDQWEHLSSITRISIDRVKSLIPLLCRGDEVGRLMTDQFLSEDNPVEKRKPWKDAAEVVLTKEDFPEKLDIIKADMIYIPKGGVSQRALNIIKRLAAFKNPEFYKAQAMRISTFNKPRIISCSEETGVYLSIPRGCEIDLLEILNKVSDPAIPEISSYRIFDETNPGKKVDVSFKGKLTEEQDRALEKLLQFETGVLAAGTAFGKTVIAAKLISERKVNTLIIVHRHQLLLQWKEKLETFLVINEKLPETDKKRGRKKRRNLIGQFGGGRNSLSKIIDIAIMQSLNREGEVNDFVKDYGMIIVDECHHIPAFSFEQILRKASAKYIYGLTATPVRQDGHHPIIFMQCGPIRFFSNVAKQDLERKFDQFLIPRFTGLRIPIDKDEKSITIQELYSEIVTNESRNMLLVEDIIANFNKGRNSLVLTERTAHAELLRERLITKIPVVLVLTGKAGAKEKRDVLKKISEAPKGIQLTLLATGKYIGEGFDSPRLDTLFLAMPIAWRGTLQQYVGRLNRYYENKTRVIVYDYVDVYIRIFEKMYNKRLRGYATFGYMTCGELIKVESGSFIYDNNSFLPVYNTDIANTRKEIFIISPFVTQKRIDQMLPLLKSSIEKKIKITVMTRPPENYKPKDQLMIKYALETLNNAGINLEYKSGIHQKFAVLDERLVWYGSINLLSFGDSGESIMRLESPNIAVELLGSVHPP